jgi:hypothetical protein
MEVNQYQKERLDDLIKNSLNPVVKIEQITETIFMVYYDNGATIPLDISKMGKMKAHYIESIYHVEYKPEIK